MHAVNRYPCSVSIIKLLVEKSLTYKSKAHIEDLVASRPPAFNLYLNLPWWL